MYQWDGTKWAPVGKIITYELSGEEGTKEYALTLTPSEGTASEVTIPLDFISPEELETALDLKVDKVEGKGLSTNDYDNTEKGKVANAVQKDGSVAMTGNLNLGSHKITNVADGTADSDAINKKQMDDAISALPTPMQFKGSVGAGGTIEWANLPQASASTGFTYKVITEHTTAPIAKVGDTIVSNGTDWIVIPSGDEPSGTVTSVGVTGDDFIEVSGSPVTSSGTIALTSKLKKAVGTLTAGQTSVNVAASGTILNVEVKDASTGDVIIADVKHTASGVTVSVAQAYTNNLTVTVLYQTA